MKGVAAAALALLAMAGSALALDGPATVKARQQGMKAVGAATKGLNDTINAGGSAAEMKVYADRLDDLAGQSVGWFPAGSGAEAGVKTAAKPAIWTKRAEFDKARGAFAAQAAKLKAAADRGDDAGVEAAFGPLRATCKGCHDTFRAKD